MNNHKILSGRSLLLLVTILALIIGCTPKSTKSGFLGDYGGFKIDPEDKSMLYYEKPNVDWKRYRRLMIDPVLIYYDPNAEHRQIQPDELKKLTDYFREVTIKEVQDAYPVVDTPGPDVLRIRAAITDVIPANPILNVASAAGVGIPIDMGGAAMEAEFLDSMTDERLGAIIDKKMGTPVQYFDGFTRLGHAKVALRNWAKELRKALDSTQ